MYADGYGRMDLARAEMPCWPGAAARDSLDCGLHSPVRPRYRAAAPDGGGQKDVLLSGRAAAVPPSAWNWSTKQPEGQASEEFNGQAGFSRLGLLGTAALAAGTGCGEEALPPAPYEGTPAFRTLSGRTGMKITIVSMGGHAHQRTRDLPGGL